MLVLVALVVFAGGSHANDVNADSLALIESNEKRSELELRDCLQMYALAGERYACGFLVVPEDYKNTDSGLIKVPFLAISPDEQIYDSTLAPLLVTGGGGPGNALLGNQYFPLDGSSFWTYEEFSVVDGRLMIILENRGVGYSQPSLDCHYSEEIYRGEFWPELLEADLNCGSEHVSNGINLSQYNVYNAALDIEMFRRLYTIRGEHTDQINLYGVSYGTHLAMYYERMFPDAVRTMVLDSVSVNEPNSSLYELAHAQRSLDLVFSRCRSDTRCRETYGANLESDFYEFLSGVGARNLSITVRWPGKKQTIPIPLTANLMIDIVHNALYSSDTISAVPLIISQTLGANYARFTAALTSYLETYSARYTFYDTAFSTYICFDLGHSSTDTVGFTELKLFKYWELERGKEHMRRVCSDYGAKPGTDLLQQAFTSDTPTLLLSGELDPVTPAASALKAAKRYSYHWNIVRENASHDVISHSACARFLASWFLYHPQEDLARRLEECEPEAAIEFLLE